MGTATIKREELEGVYNRSGIGRFHFRGWARDETYTVLHKAPGTTPKAARESALEMGDLAFGTVLTPTGIAIRVKTTAKLQAKQAQNPNLAAAVGDEIMTMQKGDGLRIEIA